MDKPIKIERQRNSTKECKTKCYNYNKFGYIAKNCRQPKKEKKPQGYFKCSKEGYVTIGYRVSQ